MSLEIRRIERPLQKWSRAFEVYSVRRIGNSLTRPFEILNETAKFWNEIISGKMPWLVKTEETLRIFKQRVDKMDEVQGLYLSIRQAEGRTPSGYIIDMLAVIPDGNGKIEDEIYGAFGELLRTSGSLLFDLHIVKLRGRRIGEVVPIGFWRYGWTSNYIS